MRRFIRKISRRLTAMEEDVSKYAIGTDLLCLFADGYSFYGAYVIGKKEVIISYYKYSIPKWMLRQRINNLDSEDIEFSVKYYFRKEAPSLFISLGGVYAINKVNIDNVTTTAKFRNVSIGTSIGYNVAVYDRFSIIPSVGIGFIVSGDTEETVDNTMVEMGRIVFGAFLNLAYYF